MGPAKPAASMSKAWHAENKDTICSSAQNVPQFWSLSYAIGTIVCARKEEQGGKGGKKREVRSMDAQNKLAPGIPRPGRFT